MTTSEKRQAIEELIYRSCLALDTGDFKAFLELCDPGFRYTVTTHSPEIKRDMVWLDHDRKGMETLFTNLPRHNSDHSPLTRHATVYTVDMNGDTTADVVSKFINAADPGACAPDLCPGVLRGGRMLTHDVIAFGVELERPCDFDAGQFVVLAAPGVEGYRGYSMTNFERGARRLDFVVKKKPGGALSQWLFEAPREGARLGVFGPLGKATFYPALGKNIVCIAGGSGIAGMMSILARAAQERYFEHHRGRVFFGVRTLRDAFFLQELT